MKNKILRKTCLAISTALLGLSLGSCSMFFEQDSVNTTISSIGQETDEKTGDLVVTIYWTDEEKEPMTIRVPRGTVGRDGVGIANVLAEITEDGMVKLTIIYTDSNMNPSVFEFPISIGEDGKGIESVEVGNDADGNLTIAFVYSDGSKSQTISIPSGVGITSIDLLKEEDGVTTYIINLSDGTNMTFDIKNGVGIASVVYDESNSTETVYALKVIYTDGTSEIVFLDRPSISKWYTGNGEPTSSLGKNGDYYLDRVSGGVYYKENDAWSFLFSMKGSSVSDNINYTVSFNANGGDFVNASSVNLSDTRSYLVSKGNYIDLSRDDLKVEKTGYKFDGWWTCPDHSEDPNAGHFTNLTPVMGNLTLYANWTAI